MDAIVCWDAREVRWSLNKRLKAGAGMEEAIQAEVDFTRSADMVELKKFAGHWPARFGPYPHLGAQATFQRYSREADLSGEER